MHGLQVTIHGQQRMSQRAVRANDVDLILHYGTAVDDDAQCLMLTNRDVDQLIAFFRQHIHRLERLRNCVVVIGENRLLTTYHTNRRKQQTCLRRAH